MTDTNQVNELYELCKKVYELTKWDNYCEYWSFGGEYTVNKDSMTSIEVQTAIIPLYTSDYLLEKLQSVVKVDEQYIGIVATGAEFAAQFTLCDDEGVEREIKNFHGKSPATALLKLTIALSEAGELK